MKNQLKESPEKYRNALAVFLNLAADNVETWLRKTIPDIPDKTDIVKRLKGENNAQTQSQIFSSAITHFFFLQWLYNQRNYFAKPNNGEAIARNYQKLVIWIERLYDLRNYWSHIDHDKVCLPEEVNEVLLELYLQACAECKAKIPERYKGTEGVNVVKKEKKSDGTYAITEVTAALSLTGTVFYACLFLDGRQINDFLESMEQSSFTFEALNKRMEHRHNHPEWPYPDELSNKKKDFFYARDVYRHWKLRGHRASFAVSAELEDKEVCFGMLEYLKRCPKEALELSGIPQDKDIEKITFDTLEYEVREKDKFFDWALAFWDEEMQRLSINGWKWARHQTTDEIQGAKNELEQEAEKAGRPYHFPRYKKVVFDIPQNPEERLNYRNDEHGFTYFLLKDDNSEKATQAMFRYQRPDGKMAIGLMNGRLLCSALEWYFYKFPADADGGDDGKKEFWTKFFHACFRHVENTLRTAKPKAIVSKEQVKERIEFLRKTYGATADRQHQKLQFILSTWNQIISYGRTMNMEHA
ncbi:MAG: hypothetical protein LBB79_07335, partial [Prevotellaceae bacterium]|nr:hypothetical protein [Prevotellaceae bacterium]